MGCCASGSPGEQPLPRDVPVPPAAPPTAAAAGPADAAPPQQCELEDNGGGKGDVDVNGPPSGLPSAPPPPRRHPGRRAFGSRSRSPRGSVAGRSAGDEDAEVARILYNARFNHRLPASPTVTVTQMTEPTPRPPSLTPYTSPRDSVYTGMPCSASPAPACDAVLCEPRSMIVDDITFCVGETPLVALRRALPPTCRAHVFVKLESANPSSTIKDRLALAVVDYIEHMGQRQRRAGAPLNGKPVPARLVHASVESGNTAVSLAMMCAARGHRLTVVMPETSPVARRVIIGAYGADVVLTPAAAGTAGALYKAEQISKVDDRTVFVNAFETFGHTRIHDTLAPEIDDALGGVVDCVVAGVSVERTASCVRAYFKSYDVDCDVIGVAATGDGCGKPLDQPAEADALGALVHVSPDEARRQAEALATREGIFISPAGAAVVHAALQEACREERAGMNIVAVVPSHGERCLSSAAYTDVVDECRALPVCSEAECGP